MKTWMAAAAASLTIALAAPASAQLADGGFEAQGAASTDNYCYFNGVGGNTACTTTPWSGDNGGGLQIKTNSAWPGAATADGDYYGFIQNAGYIQQTFTLDAGSYVLNWLAAGRPFGCCGGDQTYNVLMNGIRVGGGATTTGQAFAAAASDVFVVGLAGEYTLTFQGLSTSGDNTAFIDGVSISAVPETATWAMMIAGFGMVGGAMRRRVRSSALAAA